MALRSLGVPMQHLFGSEKNPSYRKVLQAFHPDIEHVFEDLSKRSPEDLLNVIPKASCQTRVVYTAGWPCQPFSKAGKRGGEADERSTLVWRVLLTIDTLCPDLVILENTANQTSVKFKSPLRGNLAALQGVAGGEVRRSLGDSELQDNWAGAIIAGTCLCGGSSEGPEEVAVDVAQSSAILRPELHPGAGWRLPQG